MPKIPENWEGIALIALAVVLLTESMRAPVTLYGTDGKVSEAAGKITIPLLRMQVPGLLYFAPAVKKAA